MGDEQRRGAQKKPTVVQVCSWGRDGLWDGPCFGFEKIDASGGGNAATWGGSAEGGKVGQARELGITAGNFRGGRRGEWPGWWVDRGIGIERAAGRKGGPRSRREQEGRWGEGGEKKRNGDGSAEQGSREKGREHRAPNGQVSEKGKWRAGTGRGPFFIPV